MFLIRYQRDEMNNKLYSKKTTILYGISKDSLSLSHGMYVINRESIQGHTVSKLEIIEATHIKDERLETNKR